MEITVNKTRFKKGQKPWNVGRGKIVNCKVCGKEKYFQNWQLASPVKGKFCSKECCYRGRELKGTFQNGHKDLVPKSSRGHSPETIEKMKIVNRRNAKRGELSPLYRGGLRSERRKAMAKWEYKEWRNNVFKRDDYTCQMCFKKNIYLEADHIKPWSKYPELRYDIENGRTLCRDCHMKTPTWGARILTFNN